MARSFADCVHSDDLVWDRGSCPSQTGQDGFGGVPMPPPNASTTKTPVDPCQAVCDGGVDHGHLPLVAPEAPGGGGRSPVAGSQLREGHGWSPRRDIPTETSRESPLFVGGALRGCNSGATTVSTPTLQERALPVARPPRMTHRVDRLAAWSS
jgi:hypothetical protein